MDLPEASKVWAVVESLEICMEWIVWKGVVRERKAKGNSQQVGGQKASTRSVRDHHTQPCLPGSEGRDTPKQPRHNATTTINSAPSCTLSLSCSFCCLL